MEADSVMIRSLHRRIGIFTSAGLLLTGLALQVMATEPITRSQAAAMIDGRLAAAGVIVFGAFWVLLLTISGRSEKALTGSLLRLEAAVASFTKALADHDAYPLAHAAASEHNHGPMNAQLDRIEMKVDVTAEDLKDLRKDHDRINAACMGIRDPRESPFPRRKSDPREFDGRPLRGRQ